MKKKSRRRPPRKPSSLTPSNPAPAAPPPEGQSAVRRREQLARLWKIHHMLLEKRPKAPTRTDFARACGAVERTISRDLDTMRHTLRLPVAWDERAQGFRYTRDDVRFAATAVDPSEFFALAVAAQIVRAYRGTRLEEGVRGALHKLRLELRPDLAFDLDSLGKVISFRGTGFDLLEDFTLFQTVTAAALEREELRFQYERMEDTAPEERVVEPLHVTCIENAWYLQGRDVQADQTRLYCLVRMKDVRPTGRRFVPPLDFDADALFATALGAFGGEKPVRVVLRLRGPAARVVRERRWHSSQEVTRRGEGETVGEFHVSDTPDLLQFVLRWGADAEVLEPASLRQKVLAHAREIVARG